MCSSDLVRGDAIPGQSDVLDVVVVVRRGLLAEREGFQRVLQRIAAACAPVAKSGLPYAHPPFLYAEDELADVADLYRGTLVSPNSSRVLFGRDVRPEVLSIPEAQAVARCAYFALQRRYLHPFTAFLRPSPLSAPEMGMLWHILAQMRSNLPMVVCAALGRPSNQADALADLRQALPDLDLGIFDEIAEIRRGERSRGDCEDLKRLFRRMFEAGERIGERILAGGAEPWSGLTAAHDAAG